MAKWPNHFISGKQFQKGQMATLLSRVVLNLIKLNLLKAPFAQTFRLLYQSMEPQKPTQGF